MARYIDANLLWKALDMAHLFDGGNPRHIAQQVVEEQPTVDVVEVVRCKDCRFKTLTEDGEYNPKDIVCEMHMSDGFKENDYCSYGERKCNNG